MKQICLSKPDRTGQCSQVQQSQWMTALPPESQPPQTGASTPGLALPVCQGLRLGAGVSSKQSDRGKWQKRFVEEKSYFSGSGCDWKRLRGQQELAAAACNCYSFPSLFSYTYTLAHPNTCAQTFCSTRTHNAYLFPR